MHRFTPYLATVDVKPIRVVFYKHNNRKISIVVKVSLLVFASGCWKVNFATHDGRPS